MLLPMGIWPRPKIGDRFSIVTEQRSAYFLRLLERLGLVSAPPRIREIWRVVDEDGRMELESREEVVHSGQVEGE